MRSDRRDVQEIANDSGWLLHRKIEEDAPNRMFRILQRVSKEPYNVIGAIACQTMRTEDRELSVFFGFFTSNWPMSIAVHREMAT